MCTAVQGCARAESSRWRLVNSRTHGSHAATARPDTTAYPSVREPCDGGTERKQECNVQRSHGMACALTGVLERHVGRGHVPTLGQDLGMPRPRMTLSLTALAHHASCTRLGRCLAARIVPACRSRQAPSRGDAWRSLRLQAHHVPGCALLGPRQSEHFRPDRALCAGTKPLRLFAKLQFGWLLFEARR